MRIKNCHAHPKADVELRVWGSLDVTANVDGTFTYATANTGPTVNPFSGMDVDVAPAGSVCAIAVKERVRLKSDTPVIRDGTQDCVWAFKAGEDESAPFWVPNFNPNPQLTIIALGIYTEEDWLMLQSLDVTLFDKDTAAY